MKELNPIDVGRCQCQWQGGSFMTFGPRPTIQCDKIPEFIVIENETSEDGFRGGMSLCSEHVEIMKKTLGEDFAVMQKIVDSRKEEKS